MGDLPNCRSAERATSTRHAGATGELAAPRPRCPPCSAHLGQLGHHLRRGDALVKLQAAAARLQDAGNEVLVAHHLGACGSELACWVRQKLRRRREDGF